MNMLKALYAMMLMAAALLSHTLLAGVTYADEPETQRVLFIGNSYTYFHSLPDLIAQIAEAKGKQLIWQAHTPGGRNFERHWEEGQAAAKLRAGTWDTVVLQNQSSEPARDPARMREFGLKLCAEIDEAGAEKMLFLTWAYKTKPDWINAEEHPMLDVPEKDYPAVMQSLLADAYFNLAVETNAQVAPAGLAWELARARPPDWELHGEDGAHPGPLGSYLTAMVFYAALFDDEPTDMPLRIENRWKKKDGGLRPAIEVTAEQCRAMEQIAAEALALGRERVDATTTEPAVTPVGTVP